MGDESLAEKVRRIHWAFSRGDDRRDSVRALAGEVEAQETLAQRYADALVAIVGQPWTGRWCPSCTWNIHMGMHSDDCPWLIAARALGVAT